MSTIPDLDIYKQRLANAVGEREIGDLAEEFGTIYEDWTDSGNHWASLKLLTAGHALVKLSKCAQTVPKDLFTPEQEQREIDLHIELRKAMGHGLDDSDHSFKGDAQVDRPKQGQDPLDRQIYEAMSEDWMEKYMKIADLESQYILNLFPTADTIIKVGQLVMERMYIDDDCHYELLDDLIIGYVRHMTFVQKKQSDVTMEDSLLPPSWYENHPWKLFGNTLQATLTAIEAKVSELKGYPRLPHSVFLVEPDSIDGYVSEITKFIAISKLPEVYHAAFLTHMRESGNSKERKLSNKVSNLFHLFSLPGWKESNFFYCPKGGEKEDTDDLKHTEWPPFVNPHIYTNTIARVYKPYADEDMVDRESLYEDAMEEDTNDASPNVDVSLA